MPYETIYNNTVLKVLNLLPNNSEQLHAVARKGLGLANAISPKLLESFCKFNGSFDFINDPRLHFNMGDTVFNTPTGIAAGWIKEYDRDILEALGYFSNGYVELGSILLYPQPGNPKPRQFAIGNEETGFAVINRAGLPSSGAVNNLNKIKSQGLPRLPIGMNIAVNKFIRPGLIPAALALTASIVDPYGAYNVLNSSCPNQQHDVDLHDTQILIPSLQATMESTEKPLLVKIGPDISPQQLYNVIEAVVCVVKEKGRKAGIISGNTTSLGNAKAAFGEKWRNEPGGLSGDSDYLRQRSIQNTKFIYRYARDLIIITCGAITEPEHAVNAIKAGASLVQYNTAMRLHGPLFPISVNKKLLRTIENYNLSNISQLRGIEAEN